ncbi:hypothetical protein OIU34_22745 [Pararhizobium sp. BT-229]|uniref:hypothetical protein n=1 Tax=Pararhizobium sp. BT-229 TaxID=2986923 RepID=UPI0021F712E7|nr:hypothetical protein [Pararhizobium sp. BT-229]MCV9964713.1 hypothetical protein [Pararhizobium sp. BT-229]
MEFQFEVPVTAVGRPEKYKTDRLVLATVPVSVDIEEVSRGELRPAVSVAFDINSATRLDFRCHAGRLYLPLAPVVMLERTIPLFELPAVPFHFKHTSSLVEKKLTDDGGWNNQSRIYPPSHRENIRRSRAVQPTPLAGMAFETLELPSIDEQVAMFEQRVGRLLCSDGMVHVQVAEPCISVTRSVNNRSVFLVRPVHRPFLGIRRDKSFPDAVFRIDESEQAREFCLALGAENEPLLNFHQFWLDVYDSDALSLHSDRASAYASARNLVQSIGNGSAIDNHACASQLRPLSRLVGRHNEANCPDELCDLLSSLVDVEKSGTGVFPSRSAFEAAELVSTKWDNREITFSSSKFASKGVQP